MDDYMENLIEMVRARPLLWDPRVPDYKNKDQRTQVWDELKDLLTSPKGNSSPLRVIEKCFYTVAYGHCFSRRSSSVRECFQGKHASPVSLHLLVGHIGSPVNHTSVSTADEM
ncbi:hypothetical protein ElyMa_006105500 [Elysia marginata]|uniref:MADF domain-containing protein n=1 Tax=Elysia marginata TaxID=1093978 RepID=A0AAV4GTZ1_9GAST|nr:hypothetical protein ElyMa_006105500 [Elysia marginata]